MSMDTVMAELGDAGAAELVNLYHLARTALAGQRDALGHSRDTRHNRQVWAAEEYSKAHPAIDPVAAYKALDRLLARPWAASG